MNEVPAHIAIRVHKLSKVYDLSLRHVDKFRDAVAKGWDSLTGNTASKLASQPFHALRNISFSLEKGEVLGIIGDNGAGKSTLLKLLSEVTSPTSGSIYLNGNVSSILEIGTGFHPELSGRDNIFLSGQLQGMSKEEVAAKLPQIIAFSGIGDFIDVPVKRYSSGMFIRLAFSVASHLDAEIVLLDEVLSVGDAEFRVKSLEKIQELARSGRTVVIVSHDLNSIDSLCTKALVLEEGRLKAFGSPKEITGAYIERTLLELEEAPAEVVEDSGITEETPQAETEEDNDALTAAYLSHADQLKQARLLAERAWSPDEAPGDERLKVVKLALRGQNGEPQATFSSHEALHIELEYLKFDSQPSMVALVVIYQLNVPAFFCDPKFNSAQEKVPFDEQPGHYFMTCTVPGDVLNSGIYSLDVFVVGPGVTEWFNLPRLLNFKVEIAPDSTENYNYSGGFPGPMFPRLPWKFGQIRPLNSPNPSARDESV